jgi:serine/threonine-protein kinase
MELPQEAVSEQLGRILASRGFRLSERMQRFLTYCVEAAQRGEAPKEYAVGTAVFDRKPDFDPRVDPIVRVEARRLRAKLEEYYSDSGANDEIVIELPKGGYIPVLRRRERRQLAAEARTSIAVLPFANLGPGGDEDYFSDGLTEELIHRLTRVPGLRVVAWPSASRLRGRETDLGGIRDQLKVSLVVRGSVRRSGGRVRITAQLVDASSGEFRWSESYSRDMSDLLAIQEEIAGAIAATLKLALNQPGRIVTANVESHSLCLKGRYIAWRRTIESLRKSIAFYEQAAEADPGNAVAYAGMADGYILLSEYGDMPPSEAMDHARQAALKALELDPFSAEAHTSLAMIRSHAEWDWAEAGALYRKALDLNPGYVRARHWYGLDYLAVLGRFDNAEEQLKAARELDPLSPIILEGGAYLQMYRRNYERAIAELQAIAELEPSFHKAYTAMGRVYSLQGRCREALEMFDRGLSHGGESPSLIAAIGQVSALLGDRAKALACLERLKRMSRGRHVPMGSFAILYLGLGDHEESLACLERSAERRESNVVSIGVHPLFDPLRGEPRFQNLLRRIGFLP